MTPPHTTAEQRQSLRERYKAEKQPNCPFCGDTLELRHPPDGPDGLYICRRMQLHWPVQGGAGEWHYKSGEAEAPNIEARDHAVFSAWSQHHPGDPDVLAAVHDADALAVALTEIERLRTALQEIDAKVTYWVSRESRPIFEEIISAALTTASEERPT